MKNGTIKELGMCSADLFCRNGENKVTRENPEYQANDSVRYVIGGYVICEICGPTFAGFFLGCIEADLCK